jgi:hypothetical protein
MCRVEEKKLKMSFGAMPIGLDCNFSAIFVNWVNVSREKLGGGF